MSRSEGPKLWRLSEFDRLLADEGYLRARADRATLLPTTLLSELGHMGGPRASERGADVLEIMAACMRHRESALLYLRRGDHVWPLTLFPHEHLYHCPVDVLQACGSALSQFRLLAVEPSQVRPPGHLAAHRVAEEGVYHPLLPLLWGFALHGPRAELLPGLGGGAAYRVSPGFDAAGLPLVGAVGPVFSQMRLQTLALRDIARASGMDDARAVRLINALYLVSGLMVLRTHPAARDDGPSAGEGWRARLRRRR